MWNNKKGWDGDEAGERKVGGEKSKEMQKDES